MRNYNELYQKDVNNGTIDKEIFNRIKLLRGDIYPISQFSPFSITFVIRGKISYSKDNDSRNAILDDQLAIIIDRPDISISAIEDCEIIICNLVNNLKICPCFVLKTDKHEYTFINYRIEIIEINSLIRTFLSSMDLYLNVPGDCFNYQEIKRLELLFLLKRLYPQTKFSNLLSTEDLQEVDFKTLIINNYSRVKDVKDLANLTYSSMSTFSRKFKINFGLPFNKWKKKQIANDVYKEIKYTKKSFKNIAAENNFASQAHFNRFCKKHYGNTPGELRNI